MFNSNISFLHRAAAFAAALLFVFNVLDIRAQSNDDLRGFLGSRLFARVCPIDENSAARRIFIEYGAVFAASSLVEIPPKCLFDNEGEVLQYQQTLKTKTAVISGVSITLQSAAMDDLSKAQAEAAANNLKISALDGEIAGTRSFADTVRVWNSRFIPGLEHWTRKKRIEAAAASEAKKLSVVEQVNQVIAWEQRGLFFSTDFSKSIFSSVAPPGASQHLSALAFDVVEYHKAEVRAILNRHGWYQTVANDAPHFTYLGLPEGKLPQRGLKQSRVDGFTFWVPKMLN